MKPQIYVSTQLRAWLRSDRTSLVIRNVIAALGGRAINIALTILAISIAVRALGEGQYGVLAVAISLTTVFNYADFGLGLAVVTELAGLEVIGNRAAARNLVSQIWFFLIGCAALLALGGTGLYLCGTAEYLLPSLSPASARDVWFLLLGSSVIGIPLAIAQRMFFALQMGTEGQIWSTAGRVSVVIGALAARYGCPSLEAFILAFVLLPNVVAAVSLVRLFTSLRPDLKPSARGLSLDQLRSRISTGLNFTLNHLVNFAEFGADTILISLFYSSQTVAQYDLISRLFGYVIALVGLGMWPIWPAISTAVAEHDYGWIVAARHTGYWGVVLVSSCAALFLWCVSDTVIYLWAGVHPNLPEMPVLYSALAVFVILYSLINFQQVFLIAFNDIMRQSVVSIASIVVTLPLKYFLLSNGVFAGVVIAAFGMFVVKLIYYDRVVRRHVTGFQESRVEKYQSTITFGLVENANSILIER